ncbi:hypothetical protein HFX_5234 (plasmid) [Haloferax mediterranei ATCC 33500]|uniref:Uncharacterized protein n=1 Tax=Haloferax mediterranei (strain ATCC 33500 / DSM 1411 / JCM 8866 / NBRC 14739 / NCIMB 2177 / R-4) TaxID=523841 RepID=I3RA06_HALMT|nr:hypothetical protein HFX_5234 [Haloferax mediterranei ATCC 33500]
MQLVTHPTARHRSTECTDLQTLLYWNGHALSDTGINEFVNNKTVCLEYSQSHFQYFLYC